MKRCEICNIKLGKIPIILTSPDFLNKDGTRHEFNLCSKCLNTWVSMDYDEIKKILEKNEKRN
jgi:uncharacterized protein with PIN domain